MYLKILKSYSIKDENNFVIPVERFFLSHFQAEENAKGTDHQKVEL